ncbi:MAG: dicarboxylate/amino acid:cation symporter [Armatimonadota bacterium]
MPHQPSAVEHEPGEPQRGLFARWHHAPLYLRILAGLLLGTAVGAAFGPQVEWLQVVSDLILRLLRALAPPLILIAIIRALMTAELGSGSVGRLAYLLVLNTLVAICIGLAVANLVRPGTLAKLDAPKPPPVANRSQDPLAPQVMQILKDNGIKAPAASDPVAQFLDNVPDNLLRPLVDNNKVIGVIIIAVAFGIALRSSRRRPLNTLEDFIEIAFDTLLKILHWVIDLVPIGVFGVVAGVVAKEGFAPFGALAAFIGAVLLALVLQAAYYLVRVRLRSWVRPGELLRGTRDALVMAFSTASSTATMPVTYSCLVDRVGLRDRSASLGALVGANFNNDGTALYEAMSALFISQMLGIELSFWQQLLVVLTSVVASVGAAGIPEAGLVTMTMVFTAVGLPTEYIALLITVDWFLDRCRTAINVMGDTNVSCLLDGKVPASADAGTHASPA